MVASSPSSPESDTGFSTGSSSSGTGDAGDEDSDEDNHRQAEDDTSSVSSEVAVNGRLTVLENKTRDHSVVCGTFDSFSSLPDSAKSGAPGALVDTSNNTEASDNTEAKQDEQKRPDVSDNETDDSKESPTQQLPQYDDDEHEIIFEEQLSPHSASSGVFGSSLWNVRALSDDDYIEEFGSSDDDHRPHRIDFPVDDSKHKRRQRNPILYLFVRQRTRKDTQQNEVTKKIVDISPDRTIPETPMTAAAETEDGSPLRKRRKRPRRRWDLRSSASSSRLPPPPPLPFHHRRDEAGDDHPSTSTISQLDPTLNFPLLICVLFVCLIVFVAATFGTAYAGTLVALRNIDLPDPINPPPIPPTLAPTSPPLTRCDAELEFLLEVRIRFDARPAEVGIVLADDVPFGASLWEFNRGSTFRSFSQVLRRNIFSICLTRSSASFRLTIKDRGADGLRATFENGGSTVFGAFAVAVDGESMVTYNGDCNAEPAPDDCGPFCACEYRIENGVVGGDCRTVCD